MATKEQLKKIQSIKDNLVSERKTLKEENWRKITRFCLPELSNPQDKRLDNGLLYSSAAPYCSTLSANALQGWAYGSSISWVRIAVEGKNTRDLPNEEKKWLQDVEDKILRDLRSSSFYDEALTFTKTGFNLGTGLMLVDFDTERGELIFETLNPWNCYLSSDSSKRINLFIQEFWLDKISAEDKFGDNCPEKIRKSNQYKTKFKFTKVIASSSQYDLDADGDGDWIEIIWCEAEKDKIITERRLNVPPFIAWRWASSLDGSAYGAGAPGEVMISKIIKANVLEKAELKGIQLREEPPVKATEGLAVNIVPNGITYLKGNQDFAYAPPPGSSVEVRNIITLCEQDIKEAYFVDFFLMLQQTIEQKRTATEAALLSDEKSQIMAAFASRLNREFLEVLLEAVFDIELRFHRLPAPPDSLKGKELRIDYVSPLAVAQEKAQKYAPARQFLADILSFSEIEPSIRYKFNLERFADISADILNVSRDFIRTKEETEELVARAAEEQMAQIERQNQIEDMKAQANAYSALSKKAEDGSPASLMTGGN